MPRVTIIGGPNGAGKTLFASEYFAVDSASVYLNADEIARRLEPHTGFEAVMNIRAGREMLERIDEAIEAREDVLVETTLASLAYARKIPLWRSRQYHVALLYVRLPTVEHSIARVRKRVAEGGHGMPEDVIRRRFAKSLRYLEDHYKPIVDEWEIWDSLEGEFRRAQTSED
jgi:predicted ABC-type ATPase